MLSVKIDATEALKLIMLGMETMFISMSEFDKLEELTNLYKIDLNDEH